MSRASPAFVQLNAALAEAAGRSNLLYDRYRMVRITWEGDPDDEAVDLHRVLIRQFGFDDASVHIRLPIQDSASFLDSQLQSIYLTGRDSQASYSNHNGAETCLWLIYYAGCGYLGRNGPIWTPRGYSSQSGTWPVVDWLPRQDTLVEHCVGDILIVTDCDYGTGYAHDLGSPLAQLGSQGKSVEVVSAPRGTSQGSSSFTKILTDTLCSLEPSACVNMRLLVADVFSRAKRAPLHLNMCRTGKSNIALKKFGLRTSIGLPLTDPSTISDVKAISQLRLFASKMPQSFDTVRFYENTIVFNGAKARNTSKELIIKISLPYYDQACLYTWLAQTKTSRPQWMGEPRILRASHRDVRSRSLSATGTPDDGQAVQDYFNFKDPEQAVMQLNHNLGLGRREEYHRVLVLPLIWRVSGFPSWCRLRADMDHLVKVLREDYGAEACPTFELGSTGEQQFGMKERPAQILLEDKLRSLIMAGQSAVSDTLTSDDLLIVLYTGHGADTTDSDYHCWLSSGEDSTRDFLREHVNWRRIQDKILFPAECDVAQVFDSCYAGTGAKPAAEMTTMARGRNEILGATDDSTQARVPSQVTQKGFKSFLTLVAEALETRASDADPFTLETLRRDVMRRRMDINRDPSSHFKIPTPFHWAHRQDTSPIELHPWSARVNTPSWTAPRGSFGSGGDGGDDRSASSNTTTSTTTKTLCYCEVSLGPGGEKIEKYYYTKEQLQQRWARDTTKEDEEEREVAALRESMFHHGYDARLM